MSLWIESHTTLRQHPKLKRLASALGVSLPTACGHLHFLWWWAVDYARNGDLSAYSYADIAEGALWTGDPELFLNALMGCGGPKGAGFLEWTMDGGMILHDWEDYASSLITIGEGRRAGGLVRSAAAKRVGGRFAPFATSIDQQNNAGHQQNNAGDNAGDQHSPAHQLTRPDQTRPDQTVPDLDQTRPVAAQSVSKKPKTHPSPSSPPSEASPECDFNALDPAFVGEMEERFQGREVMWDLRDCLGWFHDNRPKLEKKEKKKVYLSRSRCVEWIKRAIAWDAERGVRPFTKDAGPDGIAPAPSESGPPRRKIGSVKPTAKERQLWAKALALLKDRVSKANYGLYVASALLCELKPKSCVIVADDESSRAWLSSGMGGIVTTALRGALGLEEEQPFAVTFEAMELIEVEEGNGTND